MHIILIIIPQPDSIYRKTSLEPCSFWNQYILMSGMCKNAKCAILHREVQEVCLSPLLRPVSLQGNISQCTLPLPPLPALISRPSEGRRLSCWAWVPHVNKPRRKQNSVKHMETGVWMACSGGRPGHLRLDQRHCLQHLVKQLQRPMQLHLDPARRVLDRRPRVVGTPALHKAHLKDAQPAQVVDADAGRRRQT